MPSSPRGWATRRRGSGPRWPWARGQRGGRAFSSPRAVSAIDSSRSVNARALPHASGAMDTESPCFAAAETRKPPDVLRVPGEFDGRSKGAIAMPAKLTPGHPGEGSRSPASGALRRVAVGSSRYSEDRITSTISSAGGSRQGPSATRRRDRFVSRRPSTPPRRSRRRAHPQSRSKVVDCRSVAVALRGCRCSRRVRRRGTAMLATRTSSTRRSAVSDLAVRVRGRMRSLADGSLHRRHQPVSVVDAVRAAPRSSVSTSASRSYAAALELILVRAVVCVRSACRPVRRPRRS